MLGAFAWAKQRFAGGPRVRDTFHYGGGLIAECWQDQRRLCLVCRTMCAYKVVGIFYFQITLRWCLLVAVGLVEGGVDVRVSENSETLVGGRQSSRDAGDGYRREPESWCSWTAS